MGVDISARALYDTYTDEPPNPLMECAIEGGSHIPLEDVLTFVCLAHTYQQGEVAEILTEKVTQFSLASTIEEVECRGRLLQLMVWVESLMIAHKKCVFGRVPPKRSGRRESLSSCPGRGRVFGGSGRTTLGAVDIIEAFNPGLCPRGSSQVVIEDTKHSKLVR